MGHLATLDVEGPLARLVERAAGGEDLILGKNGVPMAKLMPLPQDERPRRPSGALQVIGMDPDKARKDKLRILGTPTVALQKSGCSPRPIDPGDAELAGGLDWGHDDPSDRMLVAQAPSLWLALVHADTRIQVFDAVAQRCAR